MAPEQKQGFTVRDWRGSADEPEKKGEGEAAPGSAPTNAPVEAAASGGPVEAAPPADGSAGQGDARELPAVEFHTFVLSLGSSALMHLGEIESPEGGAAPPDFALAKHTIDIIAMLQEKTRGNLSQPEERLIESLLYDLRLRYVERSKAAGAQR